jgi:hypothetical protein
VVQSGARSTLGALQRVSTAPINPGKEDRMEICNHQGFHSGQGRYDVDTKTLRYVVVCEACRAELREVHVQRYEPTFHRTGGRAHGPARAAGS